MKQVTELLNTIILNGEIIEGNISNPRKKDQENYNKIDIKPVLIKDEIKIQFSYNYKNKVIHENLSPNEAVENIMEILNHFRQGMFFTKDGDYQVLISKKGKTKILKKNPTKLEIDLSHNRKKEYIIAEGIPCDFLIRLGVMNKDGKVLAKKYDKFKQINRFLEMVEDIVENLEKDKPINIIDFGCGKSYLTFALYHYLVNILNMDVNIIGLDLKIDVIKFCNEIAEDLGYSKLKFIHGDIVDFKEAKDIDMVVTLHACDTATDAALIQAINWDAKIILSVPCCQHEFYNKIQNPLLDPMLKHGIIKGKLASLVTDSLRANILEIQGYDVQLLEFIDMEHTPKNILIRAVKIKNKDNTEAIENYKRFKEFWGLEDLYIERELFQGNSKSPKFFL